MPNAQIGFSDDLNAVICRYVNQKTRLIPTGDLYLPNTDWETLAVGPVNVLNSEEMLEIAFNHSLTQLIKPPTKVTRQSQSMLDLVFVSECHELYYIHC